MIANNIGKGIYIHIPFCYKKCNYCDFYSLPSISMAETYIDALCRNIRQISSEKGRLSIDSVFIGGGTPSAIQAELLGRVLDEVREDFDISSNAEISIEANPATVSLEKLQKYREMGINRISFGMQSAVDEELKILGRLHNHREFKESFALARQAGFDNINVDVMMGIPEQNIDTLKKSLRAVAELGAEHVSVYMLKIEEGTPFHKLADTLNFAEEDEVSQMYMETVSYLKKYGYDQYEISNFSKQGYECTHNIKYWTGVPYIGFGPAAHSYIDGERYSYPRDIEKFINCQKYSELREDVVYIGSDEASEEKIIFGLRLTKGIELSSLSGYDCGRLVEMYQKNGFCDSDGKRLWLTPKGMLLSNYIISDILSREKNK